MASSEAENRRSVRDPDDYGEALHMNIRLRVEGTSTQRRRSREISPSIKLALTQRSMLEWFRRTAPMNNWLPKSFLVSSTGIAQSATLAHSLEYTISSSSTLRNESGEVVNNFDQISHKSR